MVYIFNYSTIPSFTHLLSLSLISRSLSTYRRLLTDFTLPVSLKPVLPCFIQQNENWNLTTSSSKFDSENCSLHKTQTVNQNANIVMKICKVAIKKYIQCDCKISGNSKMTKINVVHFSNNKQLPEPVYERLYIY